MPRLAGIKYAKPDLVTSKYFMRCKLCDRRGLFTMTKRKFLTTGKEVFVCDKCDKDNGGWSPVVEMSIKLACNSREIPARYMQPKGLGFRSKGASNE